MQTGFSHSMFASVDGVALPGRKVVARSATHTLNLQREASGFPGYTCPQNSLMPP
jgi:hypothetical protein